MTMIELIMSIIIIGIAATGVMIAFTVMVARSADPMIHHQAIAIAEAYMEEITLRPFNEPPAGGGATRADYNSIFDYNGLDDQPPANQFGDSIGDLDAYRVRVTVAGGQLNGVSAARIDVNVTRGSQVDITLTSWRTDHD